MGLFEKKTVQNTSTGSQDEDEGNIDLYGDINIEMNIEENNPNEEFGITSSPARLNRSDSILDIHSTVDFEEADLPESESETIQMKSIATDDSFVLPEPSKWEREEDAVAEKCNNIFFVKYVNEFASKCPFDFHQINSIS